MNYLNNNFMVRYTTHNLR